MAVSGVKCHSSVIEKFQEFKKSGSSGKVDFMVCVIKDGHILLEEAPYFGATAAASDGKEFVDGVPIAYKRLEELCMAGGCRYGLYTFKWKQSDGDRDSIVFIQYCDDNAPSKLKLTYSTSKQALTKACNGINHVIEANDKDEINYFEILKFISKQKAIINKN